MSSRRRRLSSGRDPSRDTGAETGDEQDGDRPAQRGVGHLDRQMGEEVKEGAVGPLQVVHHHQERTPLGESDGGARHRGEEGRLFVCRRR